jgi:hypothetical protein
LLQYVIDQAIIQGITEIHETIPFGVFPDALQRLRRVCGRQYRFPSGPTARSKALIPSAWPMHRVLISDVTNCMVS